MGMTTNYQSTSDSRLENFLCLGDIEGLQENEDLEICGVNKMWDALHFLLTGKSASRPIENDLVSEAIVGQFSVPGEDIEEFISGTRSNRIKEIAEALRKMDFEKYIDKFNMRNLTKNDIYPSIWEYEDETDEIKDDSRTSFESLRKLYAKMAEQESAVLAPIY